MFFAQTPYLIICYKMVSFILPSHIFGKAYLKSCFEEDIPKLFDYDNNKLDFRICNVIFSNGLKKYIV